MSTPEHEEARRVVESCAEDPDYMGVGEMLGDEWEEQGLVPGSAAWVARQRRVHKLATSATVTLSWPDETAEPAPEPEPDPSDPRQIAVSLMLDAARDPNWDRIWDATAEHYPNLDDEARIALVKQICELAETADITIGWTEVIV